MTVTDYPDWGVSQDQANKIAATGVPLLSGSVNVLNDNADVVAANTTKTILSNAAISQLGYEIQIKALCAAGSTAPFLQFDLTWTDSVSGLLVGHETWSLAAGSVSGGSVYYGTGPTKANRLTVKVINEDTVNSMTVTTLINQNSRIYLTDDWRQDSFNTIPGFTSPAHDQQGLMLANFSGSIANGGNVQRILPLYAGQVQVYSRNSSAAQAGAIFVRTLADPAIVASNLYQNTIAASGKATIDTISLPRSVCLFEIDNTGAAASTYECMIIAQGYKQ